MQQECELVTLMSVVRGRLDLTTSHFYFYDLSLVKEDVERQDFKVVKCTVCCRDKHEDLYCCSHWPKYSISQLVWLGNECISIRFWFHMLLLFLIFPF